MTQSRLFGIGPAMTARTAVSCISGSKTVGIYNGVGIFVLMSAAETGNCFLFFIAAIKTFLANNSFFTVGRLFYDNTRSEDMDIGIEPY